MPIRMYDKREEVDRRVYGFVWMGNGAGDAFAVCYDENGNYRLVKAENLRPVE